MLIATFFWAAAGAQTQTHKTPGTAHVVNSFPYYHKLTNSSGGGSPTGMSGTCHTIGCCSTWVYRVDIPVAGSIRIDNLNFTALAGSAIAYRAKKKNPSAYSDITYVSGQPGNFCGFRDTMVLGWKHIWTSPNRTAAQNAVRNVGWNNNNSSADTIGPGSYYILVWSKNNQVNFGSDTATFMFRFKPYCGGTTGRTCPPALDITGNDNNIGNGSTTASLNNNTLLDSVSIFSSKTITYSIENSLDSFFTLTGTNPVSIGGPGASFFSVVSQPGDRSIDNDDSTTFQIKYSPTNIGSDTAVVKIANSVNDTFTFTLIGNALDLRPIAFAQKFEGTTDDNWDYTPDPTKYATETDSVIGGSEDIWDIIREFTGDIDNPYDGRYFWGTQDLRNSNGGRSSDHFLNFENIFVGNVSDAKLKFNYYSDGFDASDRIYYQLYFDNVAQTVETLEKNSDEWLTIRHDIPNNVDSVKFVWAAYNDGSSDYSGFDGLEIRGTSGPVLAPEIAVKGNGIEIASGSTTFSSTNNTDFGSIDTTGTATISKTFYVLNTDSGSLSLNGNPIVSIGGTGAARFTVTTQPSSSISIGDSSAFVISFNPVDLTTITATVSIANNDADENPYTFNIQGKGAAPSLLPKRSATDQVIIAGSNSVKDWGRGFEFKPKEPIIITDIGGRMIGLDTFPTLIWDVDNQKELARIVFKPTKIGEYEYEKLTNPIVLEQDKNYAITAYGDQTGYYYGTSRQANEFIEYVAMRYCGSCSKTQVFPTSTLNNFHYGTPDFLFLRSSMLVSSNDRVIAPGRTTTDTLTNTSWDSVITNTTVENEFYAYNLVKNFEDTVTVTGTPKVTISGTDAGLFSVTQQIGVDTLFALDSSMFKISFTPTDSGYKEALVSIAYTDSLNGAKTYTFKISGIGKQPEYSISLTIDSTIDCNGEKTGKITSKVNGGVRPFNYLWSNNSTDSFIRNVGAGTYSLMVIDAKKDTLLDSITITEPALLVASSVVDSNTTCFGLSNGGATATAVGGTMPYTYAWSNSATTASINGVAAGRYSITITDDNGCTDTSSVQITQPDSVALNITIDSNVTCNGFSDGGLTVAATGGTMPYTYNWSNSATTASITGVVAGTYTVTVNDANGCTNKRSGTITEPTVLSATVTIDTTVSCFGGNNGVATVSVTGGTMPYTYAWNNSATTAKINKLTAANYSVTVTDANGCADTHNGTITQPSLLVAGSIDGDTTICAGITPNKLRQISPTAGGVGNYTYQWQVSTDSVNFTDISGATSMSYQPGSIQGNNWFRRLDSDGNSCGPVTTNIIKLAIFAQPNAGFTATTACEGQQTYFTDTTTLAFGKIQSYAWSFGDQGTSNQQNPINVYKNSGSYTVTLDIVADGGCNSSITKTVSVNAMPTVSFTSSTECEGTATTFTNKSTVSTGTLTHSWDLGDNKSSTAASPSHTYTNAGYYNVVLKTTTDKGCVDSTSGTVQVKRVAQPNFSATSVCQGLNTSFTNLSTNASTYSWDFGNSTGSSTKDNPTYKYASSGTYTAILTATSADGCSDTAHKQVTVYDLPTAGFSATEVCLGQTTDFTNSSSGASKYQWVFGNGTSSNKFEPSLIYAKAGSYTVELTATTA
ncbi:MAG: PKD domain-containing protein, partial [Bacteroidia bacterium]